MEEGEVKDGGGVRWGAPVTPVCSWWAITVCVLALPARAAMVRLVWIPRCKLG